MIDVEIDREVLSKIIINYFTMSGLSAESVSYVVRTGFDDTFTTEIVVSSVIDVSGGEVYYFYNYFRWIFIRCYSFCNAKCFNRYIWYEL